MRFALALVTGLVALSSPAKADSEIHQSPLLDRGSPEACAAVRQGRTTRGGYSWQFSCSDSDQSQGQGGRRTR